MTRTLTEIYAYHEAGHAVAHWLGGLKIDFVTIMTEDGARPQVWPNEECLRNLPPDLWQQQQLIVAWAGYAADLIHLQSVNPGASDKELSGYGGDQRNGWMILGSMKLSTPIERFYREETVLLFRDPDIWRYVARIADQLTVTPTITRDEFGTLMADLPLIRAPPTRS